MAIRITNIDVIDNTRKGIFRSVNVGLFSNSQRPVQPLVGDIIYNTSINRLQFWNGSFWVATPDSGPIVTGGTITSNATHNYHTFTSTGTLSILYASPNTIFNYLVVGGGGGGASSQAGGGGAGGVRFGTFTPLLFLEDLTTAPFDVAIGQGGVGGAINGSATSGGNTTLSQTLPATPTAPPFETFSLISAGGGRGGNYGSNGTPGGSGGGGGPIDASPFFALGGAGNTPATTPSQGNPGGQGFSGSPPYPGGGGGGGATASGGGKVGPFNPAGPGGAGFTSSAYNSTGTSQSWGGGGGGGQYYDPTQGIASSGAGGLGGGGSGGIGPVLPIAGTINTGGGGGGGGGFTSAPTIQAGQSGGSGYVVIYYLKNLQA